MKFLFIDTKNQNAGNIILFVKKKLKHLDQYIDKH